MRNVGWSETIDDHYCNHYVLLDHFYQKKIQNCVEMLTGLAGSNRLD